MAGYDYGVWKSNNAVEAEDQGLLTASRLAKLLGESGEHRSQTMTENQNPNLENAVQASSIEFEEDLYEVWQALASPEFKVVNEEGVNVADGSIRPLAKGYWLYQDSVEGFSVLDDAAAEHLILVPADKHTPYGWTQMGEVVEL